MSQVHSPRAPVDEAEALAALSLPDDLADLGAKVVCHERLDHEDGLRLYAHPDLLAVGRLADWVRRERHGDVVYYNVNRHINPTNICMQGCTFCAFGIKGSNPLTWEMTHDEVWRRAAECAEHGATEIHIVAGLHPHYDLAWYEACFRGLKERFPEIHLKAFTAVEIAYFAGSEGLTHREVLERLVAAGLDSMPGGGAEIFHPEVREQICDNKCDADEWIEIHRMAHGMGIRTNATMLYGHIEDATSTAWTTYSGSARCRTRRAASRRSSRSRSTPSNTALSAPPGPTGVDDLRVIAVSRLLLDNVEHLKAYWIMLGPKTRPGGPLVRRRRHRRHRRGGADRPHGGRHEPTGADASASSVA